MTPCFVDCVSESTLLFECARKKEPSLEAGHEEGGQRFRIRLRREHPLLAQVHQPAGQQGALALESLRKASPEPWVRLCDFRGHRADRTSPREVDPSLTVVGGVHIVYRSAQSSDAGEGSRDVFGPTQSTMVLGASASSSSGPNSPTSASSRYLEDQVTTARPP